MPAMVSAIKAAWAISSREGPRPQQTSSGRSQYIRIHSVRRDGVNLNRPRPSKRFGRLLLQRGLGDCARQRVCCRAKLLGGLSSSEEQFRRCVEANSKMVLYDRFATSSDGEEGKYECVWAQSVWLRCASHKYYGRLIEFRVKHKVAPRCSSLPDLPKP